MLKFIFVLIGSLILISVIWRLYSKRFSLPCPTWLSWLVELDNPFSKINKAVNIIQHLDLREGMTVLDIGCGPGRLTIPIAKKVGPNGEVVAMDTQAGMLRKTQEKAEQEHLINIKFFHATIGKEKLMHNKFDRVLMVTVLGEIQNPKAVLKEIFNALKPEGILSITEIIFDPHYQRLHTVLKLAQEAKFKEKNRFEDYFAFTLNLEKSL